MDLIAAAAGLLVVAALALAYCAALGRRRPGQWGPADGLFVFLVMLWGSVSASLVGVRAATGQWDGMVDDGLGFAVAGTAAGGLLAVGCAMLRAGGEALGLRRSGGARAWAVVPVAAAAFLGLSAGWGLALEATGEGGGEQQLLTLISERWPSAEAAFVVLYGLLLAPVFEEVIFRGFLLPPAVARLGRAGGVVVTSGLFGLMHLTDPQAVPPLVVLGTMLALLRLRSGSLWPAIGLHVLNNVAAVGLMFLAR